MLRICLERLVPTRKDAPVSIRLPKIDGIEDAGEAMQRVLRAVSISELTPDEGSKLIALIEKNLGTVELAALEETLEKLPRRLGPGGRFVIISYHSLEDRLVKRFVDRERRDCLCPTELPACVCGHRAVLKPLTRGAVKASTAELESNPRSRSARLRAAERI